MKRIRLLYTNIYHNITYDRGDIAYSDMGPGRKIPTQYSGKYMKILSRATTACKIKRKKTERVIRSRSRVYLPGQVIFFS